MPQILIAKAVKNLAKECDKQLGKGYLELLDRRIYEKVETMMKNVRFKRLTEKDIQ